MATLPRHPLPLLDRERELEELSGLIDRAGAGAGAVVLVEGPAGIGKTALLHAAGARAEESGARVLRAAAGELEAQFGFGVARGLFERELELRGDELLQGASAHAALALGFDPQAGADGPERLHAALHGLYWLTAGLAAERPLVLVVDDAHWADDASLRFVAYVAARLEGLPLLILLAARSGSELSERRSLAGVVASPATDVIQPGALGRAAVETAARETLGGEPDEELVGEVLEATRGNPFLVVELLRELATGHEAPGGAVGERVPETVARWTGPRLDALGSDARRLAEALAVLGHDEAGAAGALAGLDNETAGAATRALNEAGLLEIEPRLGFTHPLVRQAVYDGLGVARGHEHRRAAHVLDERGAATDTVAAHLLAAPADGDPWTVERLRGAAGAAARRGAPAEAVALMRRAREEPPPPDQQVPLLSELASYETLAGDPAAASTLEAALELPGDPAAQAGLRLALGRTLFFGGAVDAALEPLLAAADEPPEDRELRLSLAAELLAVDRVRRDPGFSLPTELRFHAGELSGASAGERALLAALALDRLMAAAPAEEAVELARCALRDAQVLRQEGAASPTVLNAVTALMLADELDEVDALLAVATDQAQRRGDVAGHAAALTFRSHAAFRRGAALAALEDAREAMALAGANGLAVLMSFALIFQLDALVETGRLDEADALLAGTGLDGDLPDLFHTNAVLERRGHLRAAQGCSDEALADLLEAGGASAPRPHLQPDLRSLALGGGGRVGCRRARARGARAGGARARAGPRCGQAARDRNRAGWAGARRTRRARGRDRAARRGGRGARDVARPATRGSRARRTRHSAARRRQARGGARAAQPRRRGGDRARRRAARRAGGGGPARERRAAAAGGAQRRRRAHAGGGALRAAGRLRAQQPGGGAAAVRDGARRRDAPDLRLQEARHRLAARAGRGARALTQRERAVRPTLGSPGRAAKRSSSATPATHATSPPTSTTGSVRRSARGILRSVNRS